MKRTTVVALGALILGSIVWLVLAGRPGPNVSAQTGAEAIRLTSATEILGEPIQPIPTDVQFEPRKVALGKALFHDKRLSGDDTISCASCHSLDKGGTDQQSHSTGIGGAVGGINAPTVLNSGLNYKQFWNGRAETLEDQVNGPTHHPKEMGSNWEEILGKLRKDSDYVAKFAALYPDGIQNHNVRDAIATFERSLLTINSPFDRYLRGDQSALSERAKAGYQRFKDYGCVSCHQGMNVGGNMFQTFGVMADYFAARGKVTDADMGRHDVTKREQDKHVFRVPSLRNITQTGPYFHDGSEDSLPQTIEIMAKYQLGRYLTVREVSEIAEFLRALTGEVKGDTQ
jgi:cytochrome c peroxidase